MGFNILNKNNKNSQATFSRVPGSKEGRKKKHANKNIWTIRQGIKSRIKISFYSYDFLFL